MFSEIRLEARLYKICKKALKAYIVESLKCNYVFFLASGDDIYTVHANGGLTN